MKLSAPNKENHYALWNWLSENPGKEKRDWPGFKTMERLGIKIQPNRCFMCVDFSCNSGCRGCPYVLKFKFQCFNGGPYLGLGRSMDSRGNADRKKQIRDCWK